MARRNDHSKDEIRRLAIDAAFVLLNKQGIEGVTARKIAAEIGYSAGSLYQVFSNLDELFWELNLRTQTKLMNTLKTSVSGQSLSPKALLVSYATDYLAFSKKHPDEWSLLFEHRSSVQSQLPHQMIDQIDALFALVEQPLKTLKPNADSASLSLAAKTLWSGVHGITTLSAHHKLFLPVEGHESAMINQLVSHFLTGWCSQEPMVTDDPVQGKEIAS
jgi:AcrR family transcriptional regulator